MSESENSNQTGLRGYLAGAPTAVFATFAMTAAFATYFCMYAFRKPFAAASFEGLDFLGTGVDLKTAFVISQIIGYTASKFIGIKVLSELARNRRGTMLIALIVLAELALLVFAVVPDNLKVAAIFFNGLPLGMVWGLVVSYLEGRRTSELLMAGLSCSFIVSSGVVKDVGKALLESGISEAWMPVATGAIFLPGFFVSVWLLTLLPSPNVDDEAERSARQPMDGKSRKAFLLNFLPGMIFLLITYFFLTAFRDFRDNYGIEIFTELGYGDEPAIFTQTEVPIAFGIMITMALLNLVKDNRRGLMGAFVVMTGGVLLLGGGTALFQAGAVSGATWMILTGLGSYLAYVPFNSVLFDRMIAATRVTGTAVFAIYVADALGYTGSILIQLVKDLVVAGDSRLSFFISLCYVMSGVGTVCLIAAAGYFWRKTALAGRVHAADA